ncbi:MAG: helicase [Candidatus Hydrogenedens sp.]|nr:helicase [Candidatus Hydrogenedens sp.]
MNPQGIPMASVKIRQSLVDALRLDLIGPEQGSPLEREVLRQRPSRWYLTGFLVPQSAALNERQDATALEEAEALGNSSGSEDNDTPDRTASKPVYFPSSMGLTVFVSESCNNLQVRVSWGDYVDIEELPEELRGIDEEASFAEDPAAFGEEESPVTGKGTPSKYWQRTPKEAILSVALTDNLQHLSFPEDEDLKLVVLQRGAGDDLVTYLPEGTKAVSIFLANYRIVTEGQKSQPDPFFVFQAQLHVTSEDAFIARPDFRGRGTSDWDEQVADLQYRDVLDYSVGHGVATESIVTEGKCHEVRTRWIPQSVVERVAPEKIEGVEFQMEALAELQDGQDAKARLLPLEEKYRHWIDQQRKVFSSLSPKRKVTAEELLNRAESVAQRLEAGITLLEDDTFLKAFRIANRAMGIAARRRFGIILDKKPEEVNAPAWRPFQLAFILVNLEGIANPDHTDREIVDLLFFPTGSGKTEAYLGLAAFTLVLRRLRNPGVQSAGLSVLMRYTLRLLTLDQLGRAATLICALELERQKDPDTLGSWPFEIGLWVGLAATPNKMGVRGDRKQDTARERTLAYKRDDRKPSPIPLEVCPWCGTKFNKNSFSLVPNSNAPKDLRIICTNRHCDFIRDQFLPIVAVDEPIYRRLPCFMIATVDKFAAMPWTGETGLFFGGATRHDSEGFYGPCEEKRGTLLESPLLPPDLIIQDELHLISGPLGTMVGLYETALDGLCALNARDGKLRPKIVASTATVRRAEKQVQALFARQEVEIFPPPGPDRRNSFFARTHDTTESAGRLYVGIAAQGRSPKVVQLRTYMALLGTAQKAYIHAGGDANTKNPADPYMTLLAYFNSLRELGGSRRIIEDEVCARMSRYGRRMRVGEKEGVFSDRHVSFDVMELTSRVGTGDVAEAKRRLDIPFPQKKERVDVAIATNMISVGLDITRLGLMVVLSQPKTSAEYIQATSRVGRDHERPGLVVTLLNIHRARDRSHYEQFAAYHESFYRSVEATSVTPFSPKALDRGLAGVTVALARQGNATLTPPFGASRIGQERKNLDCVVNTLVSRAEKHAPANSDSEALKEKVKLRGEDLLDSWETIAEDLGSKGVPIQYQWEAGTSRRLLYTFLDQELKALPPIHKKFRANRSLRDVEHEVDIMIKKLDGTDLPN